MAEGEWRQFFNKDCCAGDDAFVMDADDVDAVKMHALDTGYEAFVVWEGKAYFRSKSGKECQAGLYDAGGPVTFLFLTPDPKLDVTISFNHEDQYWTHVFEIPPGATISQLKEKMLADGTKEDIDSFELRLKGQRVSDLERIFQEHTLDWEYLGPEEGTRRAKEDVADQGKRERERAASKVARKKKGDRKPVATASPTKKVVPAEPPAPPKPPPKPRLVKVLVKHCEQQDSQLTVEVMSNACVLDVRYAVMELLCENMMSEVNILNESFQSIGDEHPIGATREFFSYGRRLDLPSGPMVVSITIDVEFDFTTEIEVERGTTLREVKDLLAAQDPTGSTDPKCFGMGLAVDGGEATALPDDTQVFDKHKDLQVTSEPYIEPYIEPEEPEPPPPAWEPPPPPVGSVPPPFIPAPGYWLVIGGAAQGGILVREGQDKKSQELDRLAQGAVVEEMELYGDRLHYKKITGDYGPSEGWVSLSASGNDLVCRLPPDHPHIFTLERAVALQNELLDSFASPEMQNQINELADEFPNKKKKAEFWTRKSNLVLSAQVGPVSRFGFEGSQQGVNQMMQAFGQHSHHDIIATNGNEISQLLAI